MVARAVRTIATDDSRRGPDQLARFVVRAALEVGRQIEADESRVIAHFNNPPHCQRIICDQLRLRRVKPADRQRIARFHCVFRSILMSEELHDGLLLLLASGRSATQAKERLRGNLSKLFRRVVAKQAHPSLDLSTKDILLLAGEKLSNDEMKKRLLAYRKKHGFTQPNPPGKRAKPTKATDRKESFDVIVRRVRAALD